MNEKEKQIHSVEEQMSQIKVFVGQMVDLFKQSQFFLSVAQHMQYDDDTQFNESNVTMYLGEVEEYISLLITYMAYRQDDPEAATSSLSLEKMALKEFDRGPINVSLNNLSFRLMLQTLMTLI